MYSIVVLSAVLFALFATTHSLECRPVTCMLHCPFGFDVDVQGCPHCSCRKTSNVCRDPIFGYNCGTIDHRDCPSSHECQLGFSGLTGQCCLKPTGSSTVSPKSTTSRPVTGTSTARPVTGTSTARATTGGPRTSTRRSMKRANTFPAGSTTQARGTSSPATTTQRPVTTSRWTRPATTTQRPVTTTGRSTRPATSTQRG